MCEAPLARKDSAMEGGMPLRSPVINALMIALELFSEKQIPSMAADTLSAAFSRTEGASEKLMLTNTWLVPMNPPQQKPRRTVMIFGYSTPLWLSADCRQMTATSRTMPMRNNVFKAEV